MLRLRIAVVLVIAGCLGSGMASPASAQEGPGGAIIPQRDCQTILTCRYAKGGSYRGCLSSYSCRACSFVPSKCSIGGRKRGCSRLRCNWGA